MVLKSFKEPFTILAGGNLYGLDGFIKNLSIELGYKCIEYIPTHFNHTEYSFFPKKFHNSKFDVNNFNIRYQHLFFDCDILFVFKESNKKDVAMSRLIEHAQGTQTNKKTFIIDEDYTYSK